MKLACASLCAVLAAVGADETVTTYHMFEPKYTGLADKDAGDFGGDVDFIFKTFNPRKKTNPEAAIGDNIFEMSSVSVKGFNDTGYAECNAPGCTGHFNCPANQTDYCCVQQSHNWTAPAPGAWPPGPAPAPYHPDKNTLPGRKNASHGGHHHHNSSHNTSSNTSRVNITGYWYTFPKESEGVTWRETLIRRINSSCLAQAWRDEAGGCASCQDLATQCVADCIKSALIIGDDHSKLKAVWDKAFSSKTICPDVPLPPSPSSIVVV
jgi:hypothetical protein